MTTMLDRLRTGFGRLRPRRRRGADATLSGGAATSTDGAATSQPRVRLPWSRQSGSDVDAAAAKPDAATDAWHPRWLPITATGWVVIFIGVASWVAGWQLGWTEGMIVAGGCVVALLFAVPFVVGRLHMQVVRDLEPRRVMQGEASLVVLTVTNPSSRRVAPRTLEDRIGDRRLEIEVPALGQHEATEAVYNLPTDQRGSYRVGPALIVKADPLGLLRREVVQARAEDFWVHPRYRPVAALPVGYAKDLEGPTSDTSPAGDVAFHNLREYQPGDDYRHIHWLSTARTGTVMVRHYVDNRRPHLGVVLDTRLAPHVDADAFEIAVQVVASLTVSSLVHSQPIVVTARGGPLVDGHAVASTEAALDRLAELEAGQGPTLPEAVAQLKRTSSQVSAVALVTGADTDVDELMAATTLARNLGRVAIVRIRPSEPLAVPRARMIDVDDLAGFAAAWQRIAA